MAKKNIVKVIDPEAVVTTEILAESIKCIAEGVRKLRGGKLKDKALFLLIQHAAPTTSQSYPARRPNLKEIEAVFEGIERLEKTYLK